MRKLHTHVAQSTQTDDANFLAISDTRAVQRRVGCNSGAEKRRSSGRLEVRGDAQNESLIDDDALRVTAVGYVSEVPVRRIKGQDHIRTELFKPGPALGTRAVRVDHAANRGEVAGLELGHC